MDSDKNEIDEMYNQYLEKELGDMASASREIQTAVYEGNHAFALMMRHVTRCRNGEENTYRLRIPGLKHDMLMMILVALKPIFPNETSHRIAGRSRLRKEMESLGVAHMMKWVHCHRDEQYTLEITPIPSEVCRKLCKILFSW